jgi:hypothetical protein
LDASIKRIYELKLGHGILIARCADNQEPPPRGWLLLGEHRNGLRNVVEESWTYARPPK